MLLEERAVRRIAVDVARLELDRMLLQKTSGVTARRSGGLPVEDVLMDDGLGHGSLCCELT
jgi:hypothetical protein